MCLFNVFNYIVDRINNRNRPCAFSKSGQSRKIFSESNIVEPIVRRDNTGLKSKNPIICCYCQKAFSSPYTVKDHLGTIHFKTKKMCCDLCPKLYFTKLNIRQHMRHVHMMKRFACNDCDYKAATNTLLEKHECSIHKKPVMSRKAHKHVRKAKESCSICYRMISKCFMERHMKIHDNIQCKKYPEFLGNKKDLKR